MDVPAGQREVRAVKAHVAEWLAQTELRGRGRVAHYEVFEDYRLWCAATGRTGAMGSSGLGRELVKVADRGRTSKGRFWVL